MDERKKTKPWMTDEILDLIDHRREMQNRDPLIYKQLQKEIQRNIRMAKEEKLSKECIKIDKLDANHESFIMHKKIMQAIIQAAREPSTRSLYSYKCKVFRKFAVAKGYPFLPMSVNAVLAFLHCLAAKHLSLFTLKVIVIAIIADHPLDSPAALLFRPHAIKAFLKGLQNIQPQPKPPVPQWSLQTVLQQLTRHPFEPLAKASDRLLFLKTVFTVAITSARGAIESATLRIDS
ncbi:hypothetical protein JRQ81_003243 [Phrynocephalus forsythii]|uniref:Uncharacterized protein n=1 Tax=Phrynocephalus forsythii TaxID=171643 RepID=A0A9Q0XK74_9SAUR|nr:hypothetical protein JRQ81_003243 [Phrynocephalus forsythii]